MELETSIQQSCKDLPGPEARRVQEELLMTLNLYGPLSVEELVEQLPQFRWVEVLRSVSQLWGSEQIELEQYMDQLKIRSLAGNEHVCDLDRKKSKQTREGLELTAL